MDIGARRVYKGNREVHVSPRGFELLRLLIDNAPRAIAKGEILEVLWPNVFVSESSLARLVAELRHALDDQASGPRIIRTVHGYGYALAAEPLDAQMPTRADAAQPTCRFITPDKTFSLADGEHVAGRDPQSAIPLDSPKVSWHHARLAIRGSDATVEDLGSKNGTFVCGVRIITPAALAVGDTIRIGPFLLTFIGAGGPAATRTDTQIANKAASQE
jgi:DNA-binding winged helix-turn-helix (wHTH) protein